MRTIIIFFVVFCHLNATAHDTLKAAHFKKNAYSFHIINNKLSGPGAEVILDNSRNAQFVLLGEMHQSRQVGKFTEVMLTELNGYGFDNFVVESGPQTCKKLMSLSNPPNAISTLLRQLNRKYGSKLLQRFPFIFFHGKEDAAFLQRAAELKYKLWGIDQEFAYSYLYWIQQLRNLMRIETSQALRSYRKSKRAIKSLYLKELFNKKTQVNTELLNNKDIKNFFSSFGSIDAEARNIITALNDSWNIYSKYELKQYDSNSILRADYMKANFNRNYQQAINRGQVLPKAFIKLGNVHTIKNTSANGVEDIGNAIYKKAQANQTKVTSFRFLRRYVSKGGKLTDNAMNESWKSYWPLLLCGEKNSWTLIDFRPLRALIENGRLWANNRLKFEINNYDFILLSPVDKRVEFNF
jgi:hypothetical protein